MTTGNEVIFYTFSRSKIEAGDFNHFLKMFSALPSGRRLRDMMNHMVFVVEGYDEDDREIHAIPEVRAFYQAFFEAWPYWLFFCNLETDNLRTMILCCLPNVSDAKSADVKKVLVNFAPADAAKFVLGALAPMRKLFAQAAMFEDRQIKRESEVLTYLGLPCPTSPS